MTVPDIGGVLPGLRGRHATRATTPSRTRSSTTPAWSATSRPTSRRARAVERTRPDVALANHLVMGPVILARGARRPRALRGEGPRQRAGVHGAPRPRALPALRARGRARGRGRAGGVAAHRREPLGGARRRARAARAHPAGPARGGRAQLPPTAARRGGGRPPPAGRASSSRARRPSGVERRGRRGALASSTRRATAS